MSLLSQFYPAGDAGINGGLGTINGGSMASFTGVYLFGLGDDGSSGPTFPQEPLANHTFAYPDYDGNQPQTMKATFTNSGAARAMFVNNAYFDNFLTAPSLEIANCVPVAYDGFAPSATITLSKMHTCGMIACTVGTNSKFNLRIPEMQTLGGFYLGFKRVSNSTAFNHRFNITLGANTSPSAVDAIFAGMPTHPELFQDITWTFTSAPFTRTALNAYSQSMIAQYEAAPRTTFTGL